MNYSFVDFEVSQQMGISPSLVECELFASRGYAYHCHSLHVMSSFYSRIVSVSWVPNVTEGIFDNFATASWYLVF